MTGALEPDMAVAWLFAAEPTDRALAGWAPQMYVRQQYGNFLRYYESDPPWPPATAGGAANEAANEAGREYSASRGQSPG